ncbi:thiol-disulfide oxidoreductase DCC family protein [Leptospira sp. 201903070]|uniref:Thiol-disulfide oxidoreductase DCC family protein n=1 Tax=Leptospira ainlahdjerensis TaxID=2810033 RepID=A0ABS2UBU6_9LEPT|nr:thiol-disulfide oxidoreductase DCC family protein [Leptospira ainlahdjerensis]MBM9577825.1 thiol-disulfide oxidoreductase DCC family protein [Leptospira ainlahdjerensis]
MDSIFEKRETSIVFFDGVCNLCNGTVLFFLDHNPGKNLRFASLQSKGAERILGKKVLPKDSPSSVLFLEKGVLYEKSTAVLKIATHLSFPWNLAQIFRWIPASLRDFVYDWIAKNRYRWFGKSEACRIPSPEYKSRFLESE